MPRRRGIVRRGSWVCAQDMRLHPGAQGQPRTWKESTEAISTPATKAVGLYLAGPSP